MRPIHRLVELPEYRDDRGCLVVAQAQAQMPFEIRRLFFLHDLKEGATRGQHAHRAQHQLLFMPAGSCRVTVDDGAARTLVALDRPTRALYVPPMLWLELDRFSPGAVCAVLCSGDFDPDEFVRDRGEFEALTRN